MGRIPAYPVPLRDTGDLVVMPIATLASGVLASQVSKSSFADDQRVVYLNVSGNLVHKPLPDGAPQL